MSTSSETAFQISCCELIWNTIQQNLSCSKSWKMDIMDLAFRWHGITPVLRPCSTSIFGCETERVQRCPEEISTHRTCRLYAWRGSIILCQASLDSRTWSNDNIGIQSDVWWRYQLASSKVARVCISVLGCVFALPFLVDQPSKLWRLSASVFAIPQMHSDILSLQDVDWIRFATDKLAAAEMAKQAWNEATRLGEILARSTLYDNHHHCSAALPFSGTSSSISSAVIESLYFNYSGPLTSWWHSIACWKWQATGVEDVIGKLTS